MRNLKKEIKNLKKEKKQKCKQKLKINIRTWLELPAFSYVKSNCLSPLFNLNLDFDKSRQLPFDLVAKSDTQGIIKWQEGSPNRRPKIRQKNISKTYGF